jgi:hypothetical protein
MNKAAALTRAASATPMKVLTRVALWSFVLEAPEVWLSMIWMLRVVIVVLFLVIVMMMMIGFL